MEKTLGEKFGRSRLTLVPLFISIFASACSGNREVEVNGFVASGYEEVRSEFINNFKKRGEVGAACSIYVNGELVVDLWGGLKNRTSGEVWKEDTVVRVYSTTKGMSSVVLAKLHSDGLLDINEKISRYWPEFGRNGKEDITVAQLVQHKSGLVILDRPVNVSELHNFSDLSKLLEESKPLWEPGLRQGYCAATLGLFEQQLVRRIDPAGRSIGQYFQEEIAGPLDADFYIGLPEDLDPGRLAELQMISPSPLKGLVNLHKPPKGMAGQIINQKSLFNQAFYVIVDDIGDPFRELSYEEPSGGGVGDARSLAKIYGLLAIGGEELGINSETLSLMTEYAEPAVEGSLDAVMGFESHGSKLGHLKPDSVFDYGSDAAFGFSGTGGSFAFADPEYGIGYAYVMSKMDYYGINDPREAALREALYRCVTTLRNSDAGAGEGK